MSAARDLVAAASCADNQDTYRRMVDLEIKSTYAFQGGKWLGDVAPHLLSTEQITGLALAKARASSRAAIEAELPAHLLFKDGWPTAMPTEDEAELIASVRQRVSALLGIPAKCLTAAEVQARYADLLTKKALDKPAKRRKSSLKRSRITN